MKINKFPGIFDDMKPLDLLDYLCQMGAEQNQRKVTNMNPVTFDFQDFSSLKDAKDAGYLVPIPKTQVNEVRAMNRVQRRAWLKKQKKRGKGYTKPGNKRVFTLAMAGKA